MHFRDSFLPPPISTKDPRRLGGGGRRGHGETIRKGAGRRLDSVLSLQGQFPSLLRELRAHLGGADKKKRGGGGRLLPPKSTWGL